MLDNSRKQTRASRFSSKFREYLNDEGKSDEGLLSKLGKYATKMEENRIKNRKEYMRRYYRANREFLLQRTKDNQAKAKAKLQKKPDVLELTPEMEEVLREKRVKSCREYYQKHRAELLAKAKSSYKKKRSELSLKARKRYTGGNND